MVRMFILLCLKRFNQRAGIFISQYAYIFIFLITLAPYTTRDGLLEYIFLSDNNKMLQSRRLVQKNNAWKSGLETFNKDFKKMSESLIDLYCGSDSTMYRQWNLDRSPKRETHTGGYGYGVLASCGCDHVRCTINVACSEHYCVYCLDR